MSGKSAPLWDGCWSGGGCRDNIEIPKPDIEKGPIPITYQVPVPSDPGNKLITQLTLFGFIEYKYMSKNSGGEKKGVSRIILPCSMPRGDPDIAQMSHDLSQIEISVIRRPRAIESIGFCADSVPDSLSEHLGFLLNGMGFPAYKVSTGVDKMPASSKYKFIIWAGVLTALSGPGGYVVPIRRMIGGVAKNRPSGPEVKMSLKITLKTSFDIKALAINAEKCDDGGWSTDVLLYIGTISRRNGRPVDTEYAKNFASGLGFKLGLGSVGGVSIHVHATGLKWKASLNKTTGGKKNICFPLAEVAPVLNRVLACRDTAIIDAEICFQATDMRDVRETTSVVHTLPKDVIVVNLSH
ncbi:matrix protein [Wenling triplecross lizardfish paramyxovirus]|uniref:Matrix protein n=1 Tax=Wenling triplecross lizardfish paramyxovirus TaxID=2116451 RepID=A0A2P1GMY4_9MONO|nr:matrix protein [Wenling triplecross lizardfish paramyxovirus]AVM87365.1 matrix protein [Wenling triplecross lizardfish paramyxovirus]AVM87388.1 matrix protein [Wenling triplecross lizardfish paramyxovirus]